MSHNTRSFPVLASALLTARCELQVDLVDLLVAVATDLNRNDLLDLVKLLLEEVDDMGFTQAVEHMAHGFYEEQEIAVEEDDAPV
jgi:hypothetical protein